MMALNKVRIDKWLWSVRIFKSRTLATDACKSGKVSIDGIPVKPSYLLRREETILVKKKGFTLTLKSIDLIQKRVGAPLAQACYIDLTPEEELQKYERWFKARSGNIFREKGTGRPTKKERRIIDKLRGGHDGIA
jgi:ribosome-associated heat shock protein Hsp15